MYNYGMEKNNLVSDNWIIQLRKGVFELAILSLINQRPMYGYELTIGLKSIPFFDLADGAIYPILKRLAKQDWITFYWENSEEGPRRKYYQITEKGEKIVRQRWDNYETIYNVLKSMTGGKIYG